MDFALTNGAIKELCERCPGHDIDKISQLFDTDDMIERLDNMSWFICILSKWGTKRATGSFDGALTAEDIDNLNMDELTELFQNAMGISKIDAAPTVSVKATEKKAKAAPKSKN